MRLEQIKEIANAVLYEGYLLYPYRHSAIKNRQRWTFGVVYPQEYSEANGSIEPWMMQTECLVKGRRNTALDVHVRFLHPLLRTVVPDAISHLSQARTEEFNTGEWSLASRFANEPWEEAIEREVSALDLSLNELVEHPLLIEIDFPGSHIKEDSIGGVTTKIAWEQQPISGSIIIKADRVGEDLFKLGVQIETEHH